MLLPLFNKSDRKSFSIKSSRTQVCGMPSPPGMEFGEWDLAIVVLGTIKITQRADYFMFFARVVECRDRVHPSAQKNHYAFTF